MKRVLITGGNRGIGYNIVKQLLVDGCQVTVLDLETDHLEELLPGHEHSLLPIRCDVTDDEQVVAAVGASVAKFGSVDIAIHNACKCTFGSLAESDYATYADVFNVNYFGAIRLTKAVIPFMEKAGGGRVIYASSGVGVTGFVDISPYASSKGAIEALAKCLNIEYRHKGISFHIFHPPLTRTHSASALPVPKEFMADPVVVGTGLAKRLDRKSFIICHSCGQELQTRLCYLFPISMGLFLSKMTTNYAKQQAERE